MPELTQRLVGLMSDRVREMTRLNNSATGRASLGKLSAGLATNSTTPRRLQSAPLASCVKF